MAQSRKRKRAETRKKNWPNSANRETKRYFNEYVTYESKLHKCQRVIKSFNETKEMEKKEKKRNDIDLIATSFGVY